MYKTGMPVCRSLSEHPDFVSAYIVIVQAFWQEVNDLMKILYRKVHPCG